MNTAAPLVSVVVPARNESRFIETNIASILSQDYPRIECIVVDGGSTDATLELLQRYGSRIRWISEPDRGAFDAINKGWKLATGEILTWLNADDFWEPGAVRTAVEFLQTHPNVDVVYGTAGVVDEIGRLCGDMVPRPWDLADALLHCDHIIFQPASFIRRPILERVGWLYPAWCHDHDLWLRLSLAGGTFAVIPQRLAIDRLRFGNLGSVADLVIPNKIGLTRRFFAQPGLPPELRRLQRRSMSNAYLRGFDYLEPGRLRHVAWSLELTGRAVAADPTNLRTIAERALRPLRGRIAGGLRRLRYWAQLLRHGAAVLRKHGAVKRALTPQWLGRWLERVFNRGNRGHHALLRDMHDRLSVIERRLEEGRESEPQLAARVDAMTASLAQLAERMEQASRRFTTQRMTSLPSTDVSGIVGAPPTLRPIPGWHTYWGIDASDRLQHGRFERWPTLEAPLLMRWLADLLVVIYPGNELSRVLYLTGNFEPNEMSWLTQSLLDGMTLVDVGAHMGMYTLVGSRLVGPSGTVVAIEPSSREFQRLAAHVAINGLDNVRCLNEGVSDIAGEGLLTIAWEWNSGHNTLGSFTNPEVQSIKTERIRMRTVDEIVTTEGLARVDVVKIDAEGHETRVLAGARATLQRFKPRLLLEVFGEALCRQDTSIAALFCELERYDYALFEFGGTGELVPLTRTLGNDSVNLVALPR